MTGAFRLDPRIEASTLAFGRSALCSLRIMNDRRFPWLVLIPERPDLREIHDLEPGLRTELTEEIAAVSRALQAATGAEKINIGTLGNIVPQLHVHVIGRFQDDPAWPGPVWGFYAAVPYERTEADDFASRVRTCLDASFLAQKRT